MSKIRILCVCILYFFFFFCNAVQASCEVLFTQSSIDFGNLNIVGEHQGSNLWSKPQSEETRVVASCEDENIIIGEFSGISKNGGFAFGDQSLIHLIASNASVDGHNVSLAKLSSLGASSLKQLGRSKTIINNNDLIVPVIGDKPVRGKNFTFIIRVQPLINSADYAKRVENNVLRTNVRANVLTN